MNSFRSATFILLCLLIGLGARSYQFFTSLENITQKQISVVEEIDQLKTPTNIALPPVHLFDIKLEMDRTNIRENEDVVARVLFISFGTLSTPVNMIFTIIDSQEQAVHEESDEITVETGSVYMKSFKNLNLKPGIYTLKLKTIYGNNVEDEFRQEFEVKRKKFLGIF